jgi:hypothetical protein
MSKVSPYSVFVKFWKQYFPKHTPMTFGSRSKDHAERWGSMSELEKSIFQEACEAYNNGSPLDLEAVKKEDDRFQTLLTEFQNLNKSYHDLVVEFRNYKKTTKQKFEELEADCDGQAYDIACLKKQLENKSHKPLIKKKQRSGIPPLKLVQTAPALK